jgi:uncharacterized protein (DUF2384 family)
VTDRKGGSVSIRIRTELAGQEVTALSVLRAAGIPEKTWYRRMRKPGSWRLEELERVAGVLGTTVGALIDG